jgi:LysM repeat protein
MKFILTDGKTEFVFPVTPPRFDIQHGIRIETINVHALGDVDIPGYSTLSSFKIECMFPARKYPFINAGANTSDPYRYVKQLQTWCESQTILRYIITGTPVNEAVRVSDINYVEQDGTRDVYATVSLQAHREITLVQVKAADNATRPAATSPPETAKTYTVVKGDNLWSLCRRFYGNGNLYIKLANYNKIKNPKIIRIGQVLKIPEKSLL